ncbi:MAG: pyruvate kinase [bacterium]
MRRTKIVCTLGPASDSAAKIEALIKAGLDVARLNFSHGDHKSHATVYKRVRAVAKKLGKSVAILQDLQGPKIRVGEMPEGGLRLVKGEEVILVSKLTKLARKNKTILVSYAGFAHDLKVGDSLLLDDGLLELKVSKIEKGEIRAKVIIPGLLLSHKGINAPSATLNVEALSEKDKEDLAFGLKLGVDYVALSFVTKPEQVTKLRSLIEAQSEAEFPPKIIVKIEKHEALKNFDKILKVADAVMVARGDLGIETPAVRVPIEQKTIIKKCREAGKPVIVATQMLESMKTSPVPTRAEISDVANAVIDHADACMLSAETASGEYPVAAVKFMAGTMEETEQSNYDDVDLDKDRRRLTVLSARLERALRQALELHAQALVVATNHAEEIFKLSSFHQEIPIFVVTNSEALARQLNLAWGIMPFQADSLYRGSILAKLKAQKLIKKNNLAVYLSHLDEFVGEVVRIK